MTKGVMPSQMGGIPQEAWLGLPRQGHGKQGKTETPSLSRGGQADRRDDDVQWKGTLVRSGNGNAVQMGGRGSPAKLSLANA